MNTRLSYASRGDTPLISFLIICSLACLALPATLAAQSLDANQRNAEREFTAGERFALAGQVAQAAERFQAALQEEMKSAKPRLEKQGLFAHKAGYYFFDALYVDKAEELMKQAVTTREKLQLKKPLELTKSLSCLGMIKEAQGHLDLAIPLYARALILRTGALKQDDPELLLSKIDLAWAYGSNGQLEQMSKLSKEVTSVVKKEDVSDYKKLFNNKDFRLPTKQTYKSAMDSALKKISIDSLADAAVKSMFGNSGTTNDSLKKIFVSTMRKQLEQSIPEQFKDPSVPDTAKLDVMASWSASEKKEFDYNLVWSLLVGSGEQLKRDVGQLGQPFSWQKRLRPSGHSWQYFTNLISAGSAQYHDLGHQEESGHGNYFMSNPFELTTTVDEGEIDSHFSREHQLAAKYEEFILQRKKLLNLDIRQHQYMRTVQEDSARILSAQIKDGLNKQAWYFFQPVEYWKSQQTYIKSMELSLSLDKKLSALAKQSALAAGQQFSLSVVTAEAIARALPPNTTLIEFFKFEFTPFDVNYFSLSPAIQTTLDSINAIANASSGVIDDQNITEYGNADEMWKKYKHLIEKLEKTPSPTHDHVEDPKPQTHYGVFVLPSKNARAIEMIDLGSAAMIDSLLSQCRIQLQEVANLNVDLFAGQISIAEKAFAATSKALYNKIFKPFVARLPGSGVIYLAPDGDLHLLPFSMLVDDGDKYLVDRYEFNIIDSGKDFLVKNQKTGNAGGFAIFADADYDAVLVDSKKKTRPANNNPGSANLPEISRLKFQQTFKFPEYPTNFKRLTGTKKELEIIRQHFTLQNEKIYSGTQATEANLYRVQRPRQLHIATHGFFLTDQFKGSFQGQYASYLRAGLALSFANHHKTLAQYERGPENDGIITAFELFANMDLTGTDLVVLSACETGLGTVTQGEGVYGLRRAFQMVGAQSVVMSLWPIKDEPAAALMASFYGNLAQGMNKSTALHHAMLKIKKEINSHPYFWAPFICAENLN